jgi:dipeptidyl aminopeptidase/acylaminoacyl peptidase
MGKMASVGSGDILSLLDAALKLPGLNAQRVGVMGGSYGGFMTSWLVTQTDRFAVAVSERSLNDWDRSGDIGYYYPDYYIGETAEEMRASSPITYADAITTPMLLIQSEKDMDTPLVQAERLFFALKLRGAEVEMLIFPGEGHDLTRSGLPSHRVARFDAVVEWLDLWLKVP